MENFHNIFKTVGSMQHNILELPLLHTLREFTNPIDFEQIEDNANVTSLNRIQQTYKSFLPDKYGNSFKFTFK